MGPEVSDFSLSHTCLVWKIVSDSPSQMENEVSALLFYVFSFHIFPQVDALYIPSAYSRCQYLVC